MKFLFALVLLVLLGVGVFLGELGVVPGLSDVMGTRKSEDLGITATPQALEELKARYQDSLSLAQPMSASETPAPEPRVPVARRSARIKVTSGELSAWLNARHFKAIPLRDVQARSTEGALELSGHLDRNRLAAFADVVAQRNPTARALIDQLEELDGAPIYVKFSGGIEQGQLKARLQSLRVGALPLPEPVLHQLSEREIKANVLGQEGLAIEHLSFGPDQLNLEGVVPFDLPTEGMPH